MFRFTIRDLLWLMVVIAITLCWWLDNRSLTVARSQVNLLTRVYEVQERSIEDLKRLHWEHVALLEDQLKSLGEELAEKTKKLAERNSRATLNDP